MKRSVLAIVGALLSAPAFAGDTGGMGMMDPNRMAPPSDPSMRIPAFTHQKYSYRTQHELRDLREEGLKLRDADGGTLTPEHTQYLQAKLDAILAEAKAPQ